MINALKRIKLQLTRNGITIDGKRVKNKQANLEWWNKRKNVGDYLSYIIYDWMLSQKGISIDQKTKSTFHVMALGSILGMGCFDAVVWGSGVHCFKSIESIFRQASYRKYYIRSVRGPITAEILKTAGYDCPSIYGDPAVLMPLIYNPNEVQKKYSISLIQHMSQKNISIQENIHVIDVETNDYKSFIDQILQSEKIISSSLHGIILSESYGVPAIFLNHNMETEVIKFLDWYYSTERKDIIMASSVRTAIASTPMQLPKIDEMQKRIMEVFPYDLWGSTK